MYDIDVRCEGKEKNGKPTLQTSKLSLETQSYPQCSINHSQSWVAK